MRKVVLISQQGSGTNLFRSLLNSHPDIAFFDELFTKSKMFGDFKERVKGSKGFNGEAVYNYLNFFFDEPCAFHKEYIARNGGGEMKRGAKVLGFDLKYNNYEAEPSILNYIIDRNIDVIHFKRDTGRTFLRTINDENKKDVRYSDFKKYINTVDGHKKHISDIMRSSVSNYLDLHYEDMTRGKQIEEPPLDFQKNVLGWLGVEQRQLYLSDWFVFKSKLSMRYK